MDKQKPSNPTDLEAEEAYLTWRLARAERMLAVMESIDVHRSAMIKMLLKQYPLK